MRSLLIGIPVLALAIGCASPDHRVVYYTTQNGGVVSKPTTANPSSRTALVMDWMNVPVPVPRVMAIPEKEVVSVFPHPVSSGTTSKATVYPYVTPKVSPAYTNQTPLTYTQPTQPVSVAPAALASAPASASTPQATPTNSATPVAPTATQTTPATPVAPVTAPTTSMASPAPVTLEPVVTPAAATTASQPMPTSAETTSVTPTAPVVVPTSAPALQELPPAPDPAPLQIEPAPSSHRPPTHRNGPSEQEIEALRKQIELIEKQIREQHNLNEQETAKP